MYQRVGKGKIRIKEAADDIYDCNYLSFKNPNTRTGTTTGTRTFYAFITNIEYINNITSEITFQIDPMQTWLPGTGLDYELLQCFIERQHTLTDRPGDNLVPENLFCGDYLYTDPQGATSGQLGNVVKPMKLIVAATFDTNYDDQGGVYNAGLFSGLTYNIFDGDYNGAQAAANFIDGAVSRGKANGIVCVYYAPEKFSSVSSTAKKFTVYGHNRSNNIDGYNPKNAKLQTFPYQYELVSDLQGNSKIYPYEYFDSGYGIAEFELTGDFTCNPMLILAPKNYLGIGANNVNYEQKITLSGWPQVAWNTDTFKAWLAQVKASAPFTAMQIGWGGEAMSLRAGATLDIARMAGNSAFTGAVIGTSIMPELGLLSAASNIANILSQGSLADIKANQPHGTQAGTALAACGLLDFAMYKCTIRREFAEIIDNYFTMYGYAIKRIDQPMIHARQRYTYIKTQGCKINGNLPADAEKIICDIFDRGITFWADHNNPLVYGSNPLLGNG